MENTDKNVRLKDMGWLLNDLVLDLSAPSDVMQKFKELHNTQTSEMAVARMCISSMVIGLCKFDEISQYYGKEIRDFPDELKNGIYSIKQEVEKRRMYSYRSKYLAHSFSKDDKMTKPLEFSAAVDSLKKIIGDELKPAIENGYAFCKWVYDENDESCVVNIIHQTVFHIDEITGGMGKRA